jgi:hypothetical protein
MLEILRVIEDPDYASVAKETAPSGGSKSLKRKRSDSAEHNTCPVPDAQREIYETMMAMRVSRVSSSDSLELTCSGN